MQSANRSALKEWAVVERVLADGGAILLVRKGGIQEKRGEFTVEHREFWIMPTAFHQNVDELAAPFSAVLEDTAPVSRDLLELGVYAVVEDAVRIERLEVAERLDGLHPLNLDSVRARFAYRNRPYVHALILRAYGRREPHAIPNTLDYEGCVSWVELDVALSTEGLVPVLSDEEFADRRSHIMRQLELA